MKCRFCNNVLTYELIDLVGAPASNSFLTKEALNGPEVYFPLKVLVCDKCFLVQVDEYKKSDSIFDNEYVYFSSFSKSWLQHAKAYADMISERLSLTTSSLVIEIASNDGYLLTNFVKSGIPVLGIEPTANTAAVAREKGVETLTEFFGTDLALSLSRRRLKGDLVLGNNVLAHVPDIVDFVRGMKIILQPGGTITMEFPHLLQLIENTQFDTIYHEHFSYLSFYAVKNVFESNGLELYNVEELPTHGGSLRIFAKHSENKGIEIKQSVSDLIQRELSAGVTRLDYYSGFTKRVQRLKLEFLQFVVQERKAGKKIAGYGAAAKGNTLLNYYGIKSDLIDFVVDANPAKQDKYMPGSHIPVVPESWLKSERPDYVIIFPWNLKHEIMEQLKYIREWHGQFIIPIPQLTIA